MKCCLVCSWSIHRPAHGTYGPNGRSYIIRSLLITVIFCFNPGKLSMFLKVIRDLTSIGVDLAALRVRRRLCELREIYTALIEVVQLHTVLFILLSYIISDKLLPLA